MDNASHGQSAAAAVITGINSRRKTVANLPSMAGSNTVTTEPVGKKRRPSTDTSNMKRGVISDFGGSVDTTPRMFCEILYNESDCKWHMCRSCSKWACAKCTCLGRKKNFICSSCK